MNEPAAINVARQDANINKSNPTHRHNRNNKDISHHYISFFQSLKKSESFLKYSIVYKCISVFVFDKTVVQTWKKIAIIERTANELKVDEEYSSDSPNVCDCCQISAE